MPQRVQSPSSINTYRQCPRKYYYQYIEELPTRPSIHLIRGNVVHSALEDFFDFDPKTIEEDLDNRIALQRHVLQLLIDHWDKKAEELQTLGLSDSKLTEYLEESKLMVLNHITKFHTQLMDYQHAKSCDFETAFKELTPIREKEYRCEENRIRGFIDAIEITDGKVRIMDYKTSKRATMSEAYKRQLSLYAFLYKLEHGKLPDEVGIYFLKHGERTLPVDNTMIRDAQFEVEQIHASTETDDISDYPLKTSPLCRWSTGQCDFYEKCFSASGQRKL